MRIILLLAASACLFAQSEQKFAEIKNLKLESGRTLEACRIGYRTFGTLDATRSNAVLWPTWFSGQSGNLASNIGPGKMLDTSRFYAIAVDAIGNGVSCSPSNGAKPFPRFTIRDMVHSQYRLLTEHLGITHLHAVMGISMGGMQTFEWLVAYPGFMDRAVPIVGSARLTPADILLWEAELRAIESLEKAGADPRTAMPAVLTMHEFALTSPAHLLRADLAEFERLLDQRAREGMDPRDWAAQLRAMLAHDVTRHFDRSMEKAAAAVRARVLAVVATEDHMVNPATALEMASRAGFSVVKLEGECGHMATSCEAGRMSAAVAAFLTAR